MPAPVHICDPADYKKEQRTAPISSLQDPTINLRNFLAASKASSIMDNQTTNTMNMDDISMSPRLLGYVFSCISSALAMITSIAFYARGATLATPESVKSYMNTLGIQMSYNDTQKISGRVEDMNKTYHIYFGSGGNLVQQWKVYGGIAVSGLITLITLVIVVAHFDSVCCVKKNRVNFRDGSKVERNLLLCLIVISAFALQINTSKFSIGEAQANAFFSTWVNFISCCVNYEIWRKGSGKKGTFKKVLGRMKHWFLLAILTTISFLAIIDFFLNNNLIDDSHNLGCLTLSIANNYLWYAASCTLASWIVVLIHRYYKGARTGWRALTLKTIEVILLLGIVGVNGRVVNEFAGGRLDHVQCPSNIYFAVWGTFFCGIWILATMIQESGPDSTKNTTFQ